MIGYNLEKLNSSDFHERMESVSIIEKAIFQGKIIIPEKSKVFVNNHIHTKYSFSPYYPSFAVWKAVNAGLATCGIMDHDSVAGAEEFITAGKAFGIETTVGFEVRCSFEKTSLNKKVINNPDQDTMVYVAVHGIPHNMLKEAEDFLQPIRIARKKRNIKMIENLNNILHNTGIKLNYKKDVLPISLFHKKGTVTERHILFALSKMFIDKFGTGENLISAIINMKIKIPENIKRNLLKSKNPYLDYDLLGLFKGSLVERFFVPAYEECPSANDIVEFAKKIGAISAYAYLGDVKESVTGDKKSQKFEDEFIDELFEIIHEIGFNSVTYMPSRNTNLQIEKVRKLCKYYNFMEISGEDINSPRQSFICKDLENPKFHHLVDSTWALINHEKLVTISKVNSIMSEDNINKYPKISDRINIFKNIKLV